MVVIIPPEGILQSIQLNNTIFTNKETQFSKGEVTFWGALFM